MTDTSQHRVIRQNYQGVFASVTQFFDVVRGVFFQSSGIEANAFRNIGVNFPDAIDHIFGGDDGGGCGVIAGIINPEDGVEDLGGSGPLWRQWQ